jgi:hypothetical protein
MDITTKSAILKWIFAQAPIIIIKNDFMDAEQIAFVESEQKIYWENWSPRENLTYARKEIQLDEAWEYAVKYADKRIEKARDQLKI